MRTPTSPFGVSGFRGAARDGDVNGRVSVRVAAGVGRIDGVDVCPDCQTPSERRDLAQRIVAMVEAEIAESGKRGGDPLPHEAALIAFALSLRETSTPPPPPPDPTGHSELGATRPGSVSVDRVTGAFLTGRPLRVPVGDYDELQGRLVEALRRAGDKTWSANIESWRQGGTYHSGGGFTSMLPLVLARREGPAMLECWERALAATPREQQDWWRSLTDGWEVETVSCGSTSTTWGWRS